MKHSAGFLVVARGKGNLLALAFQRRVNDHLRLFRRTVVPEIGVNLGYDITPRLRAYAGYNLIYWSTVVRPGEQIDRVIDVTQVPNSRTGLPSTGQLRPAVLFKDTGFWVQGMTVGLEYRW
jgi:hypothetical protein